MLEQKAAGEQFHGRDNGGTANQHLGDSVNV